MITNKDIAKLYKDEDNFNDYRIERNRAYYKGMLLLTDLEESLIITSKGLKKYIYFNDIIE